MPQSVASLIDCARLIIYDRSMFIIQATGLTLKILDYAENAYR
jgi:hypothetical protein